jgi:hypothetical protein
LKDVGLMTLAFTETFQSSMYKGFVLNFMEYDNVSEMYCSSGHVIEHKNIA